MKKILIIDTDIELINELAAYLNEAGYYVEAQTTAQDGLAAAHDASLIIAEVDLPEQPGFGFILCTTLKSDPATAYLPVLLMGTEESSAAF